MKYLYRKNNDNGTVSIMRSTEKVESVEWIETTEEELPPWKYRSAWNHDLTVNIEKAKEAHKELIQRKAYDRVEQDGLGNRNFDLVLQEVDCLDFESVSTVEELEALWPESIELRKKNRD